MAYDFIKLGDVEAVKSLNETAKVLVEQDGEIKRIPKNELGGIKIESSAEAGQAIVVKEVDATGAPTEWETKNLPTSNWNQNDPSGDGYIENRPFYDERIFSTFVEETELIYPEGRYVDCNWDAHKKGDLYIIIVDGIEYESIMTTDDGFPFLPTNMPCPIWWRDNYFSFAINDNIPEGKSFIVKIVHVEQGDITTIPEKYIPDTIARVSQTVMANDSKEIILISSTTGSTKQFKITVNDEGVLTVTEVI